MKLSEASIDWAKEHISLFYDSDFFPKPFEFSSIWKNWEEVKAFLSSRDLAQFDVQQPIYLPAPKPSQGFRIVHQLDPIDSLIYAALAYEISESVESNRVPIEEERVFSYRINVKANGEFFSKGNGYNDYKNKSMYYAVEYEFVLVADITDFYNQIYHHRLQNAIEVCDKDGSLNRISKDIELFLMKLTTKVSRGVPVGPAASIIMSEALLTDIDQYIINNDVNYVRYVDDIRIFSNSEEDLLKILNNLTTYLYATHRLTLSSSKTKIINTNTFIETYLQNDEEVVKSEINRELEKLNIEVHDYADYVNKLDKLPDDSQVRIQGEAFASLMYQIVQLDTLELGLARHILRRSKRLQSKAILDSVLNNFDFFTPVIRDVILYLEEITTDKMVNKSLPKILSIIAESKMINLPFVNYWVGHYFATNKLLATRSEVKKFLKNNGSIRNQALHARTVRNISWVREYKTKLDQLGPWDRRAVIYAARILSPDERETWLRPLEKKVNNLLEKCLIKDVLER